MHRYSFRSRACGGGPLPHNTHSTNLASCRRIHRLSRERKRRHRFARRYSPIVRIYSSPHCRPTSRHIPWVDRCRCRHYSWHDLLFVRLLTGKHSTMNSTNPGRPRSSTSCCNLHLRFTWLYKAKRYRDLSTGHVLFDLSEWLIL